MLRRFKPSYLDNRPRPVLTPLKPRFLETPAEGKKESKTEHNVRAQRQAQAYGLSVAQGIPMSEALVRLKSGLKAKSKALKEGKDYEEADRILRDSLQTA